MQFDLGEGVGILERTPPTLRAMLDGLAPRWLDGHDGEGTWNPREVLAHLIHGERTDWIPRARMILSRKPGPFPTFDRTANHLAARKPVHTLLDEFADERARGLQELSAWRLTSADLALVGEHPEFGRVTLAQLLATWVAHDLGHIVQISRTMARQYRDAVGPWRAYMSVMNPSTKPEI